jgi:hypothetical protein
MKSAVFDLKAALDNKNSPGLIYREANFSFFGRFLVGDAGSSNYCSTYSGSALIEWESSELNSTLLWSYLMLSTLSTCDTRIWNFSLSMDI